MIKKMKQHWLLWIILGPIILGLGIFLLIRIYGYNGSIVIPFNTSGNDFPGLDIMLLTSGLLILLLAVYLIFPAIKSATKGFKAAYGVEFGLAIVISLIGFIIPFISGMINKPFYLIPINFGNGPTAIAEWYGIIFWAHGAIKLAECAFSSPKRKGLVFAFGLFLVTFGVFVLLKGASYLSQLEIGLAWAIAVIGLLITIVAIMGLAERKKPKRENANG